MTIAILIDLALAGLLVATIVYAAILNRRLAILRDGRSELAQVVEQLNHATANALAAIEALKQAAGESGKTLQGVIDTARAATEELGFLVGRGERAADRVEMATRTARIAEPALAGRQAPRRPESPKLTREREPATEPPAPLVETSLASALEAGPAGVRQSLLKALEKMR